jgi:hypothetical protein
MGYRSKIDNYRLVRIFLVGVLNLDLKNLIKMGIFFQLKNYKIYTGKSTPIRKAKVANIKSLGRISLGLRRSPPRILFFTVERFGQDLLEERAAVEDFRRRRNFTPRILSPFCSGISS